MQLPVNLLTWGGAASPVLLLLVLLIYLRCSAVLASLLTALLAAAVALLLYRNSFSMIAIESTKGLWNSLSIMAVIFPAILIYEISQSVQAFTAIQQRLTQLIPNKLLQILAIGWGFSSFLQGPSGFGVPVAVTAPLLIGIGVRPLWAVVIALLAHAWGNLFGTLGLGWEALIQQVPLTGASYWGTAWWTAIFTGGITLIAGGLICWQYQRLRGLTRGFVAVLVIGGLQAGLQLLVSQYIPSLAVVVAATVALIAAFLLAKLPMYQVVESEPSSPIMQEVKVIPTQGKLKINMTQGMLPYYLLVVISVLILLIEPIYTKLAVWQSGFAFPRTESGYGWVNQAIEKYGATAWLVHSGFFLLLAALITLIYYHKKQLIIKQQILACVVRSWHKFVPSALSVMFLLMMSKIMSGSGQIHVLAEGTAQFTGEWYAVLAPFIGTLGAFMASSAVSSNILFGQFQDSMAQLTHRSADIILAGQSGGAALGTMISPSKVLLATTTAGIFGQEGLVFKKLLPIAISIALLMGIMVYLLS